MTYYLINTISNELKVYYLVELNIESKRKDCICLGERTFTLNRLVFPLALSFLTP